MVSLKTVFLCVSIVFVVQGVVGVDSLQARQLPKSDSVADAIPVSASTVLRSSLKDATVEPGEPSQAERSVWYRFRSSTQKVLVLGGCRVDKRLHIHVYEGEGGFSSFAGPLEQEASLPPALRCSFHSRTAKAVLLLPGKTYYLQIFDQKKLKQNGKFTLHLTIEDPPANDMLSAAQSIRYGDSVSGEMAFATSEGIEGDCDANGSSQHPSVWYIFKAPRDERIRMSTSGANEHQLSIYRLDGAQQDFSAVRCLRPDMSMSDFKREVYHYADFLGGKRDLLADYSVRAGEVYAVRVSHPVVFSLFQRVDRRQPFSLRVVNGVPKNLGLSIRTSFDQSYKDVLRDGLRARVRCVVICTVRATLRTRIHRRWVTVGKKIVVTKAHGPKNSHAFFSFRLKRGKIRTRLLKGQHLPLQIRIETGFFRTSLRAQTLADYFVPSGYRAPTHSVELVR